MPRAAKLIGAFKDGEVGDARLAQSDARRETGETRADYGHVQRDYSTLLSPQCRAPTR